MEENKKSEKKVAAILFTVLINLFPCAFILFKNCYEVELWEVLLPFLFFMIESIMLLSMFYIIFKELQIAGAYTGCMQFVLLNYQLIPKYFGEMTRGWWLVTWGIISIFLITGFLIRTKKDGKIIGKSISEGINLVGTITLSVLILVNFIPAMPKFYFRYIKQSVTSESENITKRLDDVEKPNIYFIFVDEYSSENTFETYCNYSNETFINDLEDLGFNVANESSSGSTSTEYVWASLLTLDGKIDYDITTEEHRQRLEATNLFDVIKEKNYQIDVIDTTGFINTKRADKIFNKEGINNYVTDSAMYYIMERTVFFDLYNHFAGRKEFEERVYAFKMQLDQLKKLPETNTQPTFTVFYTDIVHGKWGLDENGKLIDDPGWHWDKPEYYINHVKFFNKSFLPAITELINKDPNCVVIIESDHSFRQPYYLDCWDGIPMVDEDRDNRQMSQIFNAVYYQGKKYDENEGASYVNTVIHILNKAIGTNIPEKEFQYVTKPLRIG